MTKLLDQAIQDARRLDPAEQDEIARIILAFIGNPAEIVRLSAEERAAVTRSREAAEAGMFVSDEEVRALWPKHGL